MGFLAGLGVGGGSLLILWLTAVLSMEQRTAQGVNLLFFLPAAVISCLMNHRAGRLDREAAVPAVLAGAVGAEIGRITATEVGNSRSSSPFASF